MKIPSHLAVSFRLLMETSAII